MTDMRRFDKALDDALTVFNVPVVVCKHPRPYLPCADVRACAAGGCQYKPDLFALLNMPGAE